MWYILWFQFGHTTNQAVVCVWSSDIRFHQSRRHTLKETEEFMKQFFSKFHILKNTEILILVFRNFSSFLTDSVRLVTANFDAGYMPFKGFVPGTAEWILCPKILLILTMCPIVPFSSSCLLMYFSASFVTIINPIVFVCMVLCSS